MGVSSIGIQKLISSAEEHKEEIIIIVWVAAYCDLVFRG